MNFHIFNPENDLALADGNTNYCPPPSACKIASDLAALPLWYANYDDCVYLPCEKDKNFHKSLSKTFKLSQIYSPSQNDLISEVIPWGWSRQIYRRVENFGLHNATLPSLTTIDKIRELSNRKISIKIFDKLKNRGIDLPPSPKYLTTPQEIDEFICSMPLSVIKAPWSGSGKGIAWGLGRKEIPVEHFYKGIIRKQGGVICETFLNKKVDFAMEFYANNGIINFVGYSLFKSNKGVYSGNILARDEKIEDFINSHTPINNLETIKENILIVLNEIFNKTDYKGYFGIDMMLYADSNGVFRINPCVELNLRMNMGAASHIIYDKFIDNDRIGEFNVTFYKRNDEALSVHNELKIKYPPTYCNGKLCGGYMALTPIDKDTRYSAYVIIADNNQNSLSSLYNL